MKNATPKNGVHTRIKALLLMMAILCITLYPAQNVCAEASKEVTEARNGILRVDLLYSDKDNNEYLLGSGSGFLINNDTIITCAHVVNLSQEDAEKAGAVIGGDFMKNYKNRLKIRVVVMRDLYVYATVKHSSNDIDFAILSLNDSIYNRNPLTLDLSEDIQPTMQVHSLGFPVVLEPFQNINSYQYDDVNVTSGTISKLTTVNNVDMIQHSAELSGGNSGGPLVTNEGNVIGVNNASVDNKYYYAIDIKQIVETLDTFGVEYFTSDGSSPQTDPEEQEEPTEEDNNTQEPVDIPEPVDKAGLMSAVSEAQALDTNDYTEESLAAFHEAFEAAKEVNGNAQATQVQVDSALAKLQDAKEGLVLKPTGPNMQIIIIAVIGVVVVLAIILVVVLIGGKNKKTPPVAPPAPTPTSTAPPTQSQPQPSRQESSSREDPGTTVLNTGAGETTLLTGGSHASAKLRRVKTGESITIDRAEFTIGKERSQVNYCIAGDSSISRKHAKISVNGGEYMIADLGSTNGTFVNGTKIEKGHPVTLKNGDKVVFSEEEFEFRI